MASTLPGTRKRSKFVAPRVLRGTGPSVHCFYCIMVFYGDDREAQRDNHENLNHSQMIRETLPAPKKEY